MEQEENIYQYIIGSGAGFPITLTTPLDSNGEPLKIYDDEGNLINLVTWSPQVGSFDLIKQNLLTTLNTPLGFSIRNDLFGSRIMETVEEQNTQVLNFLLSKYIKTAIENWEPRVYIKNVTSTFYSDYAKVVINMVLSSTGEQTEFEINYNLINNMVYGNE